MPEISCSEVIEISMFEAYAAACKTEQQVLTADQTLLQLPSNWDGPFVAILPDGGAAVAVAVAGFLGISALVILSNLE